MEDTSPETVWIPPAFDFSRQPSSLKIVDEYPEPANFARYARWSPDGSAFLTQCENHRIQVFEMGDAAVTGHAGGRGPAKPKLSLPQASPVVTTQWYPSASARGDPSTYCFVASVRECPVKLLDAKDGRLRASYRIVDHRERQIAPQSLAFSLMGDKLYCGFEDAVEIFDVACPGEEGTRLRTTPSKKSKDGLKGIISALAFSTLYGSDDNLFAAGSLAPTANNIGLFLDSQETMAMSVGGGPRAGVVQLQFNPYRPHILYAAYRGAASGQVYSWDIRANVDAPLKVYDARALDESHRPQSPPQEHRNQKMMFGLDVIGRYLGIGNYAGEISIFDLESSEAQPTEMEVESGDAVIRGPDLRFPAHQDSIGSVAFHPLKPHLLSASGSRHWQTDEDEGENDEDEAGLTANPSHEHGAHSNKLFVRDSSIKFWDCSSASTLCTA